MHPNMRKTKMMRSKNYMIADEDVVLWRSFFVFGCAACGTLLKIDIIFKGAGCMAFILLNTCLSSFFKKKNPLLR